MESHDSASLDVPKSVVHIGGFNFNDNQLRFVLANLEHARGINTSSDVALGLRYKWPKQFPLYRASALEKVIERLSPNVQAVKPTGEFGGIDDYMYGQPLEPEGGWSRVFERLQYTSRLAEVTKLVNAFKIELREAEAYRVRNLAKKIEPHIVTIILTNKLFSDLSSADIALGLTNRYSRLVQGQRYVWVFPFTEMHVELIWHRSQLDRFEFFEKVARYNKQGRWLRRLLMTFMKRVEAGRADETSGLDPRSCGNEESAANLVEEVIHSFLSFVDSKHILQGVMTEQIMHG